MEREGLLVNKNTIYKGYYEDGNLEGQAIIKCTDGYTYSGEVKNWVREGFGIGTDHNSFYYEGEFVNGRRQGKWYLVQGSKEDK